MTESKNPPTETHRGAFGEFGGETSGLIERTFRERILLVGVTCDGEDPAYTEELLAELAELVDTAGADVVETVHQRRPAPHPATYVGKGKAEELKQIAEALDCDTVVFDDELTPAQQFTLERILGRTALDRTAVILDIFAQNAGSPESRAQVELAQLKYRLPRLRGKGRSLSQQGGGIGTRGPGETQLEVDRRRITRRMHALERNVREFEQRRSTQSAARVRSGLPLGAIVGYTNAGKSTLLNALTDGHVLAEDRLFATLDATVRRMSGIGGEGMLLTDTVGFVRKLPHQLVESFRSTLTVVTEADLLIHVVDASGPDPRAHIATVREVLAEIGVEDANELIVFNKLDAITDRRSLDVLLAEFPGSVTASAGTGLGMAELRSAVGDRLRARFVTVTAVVPFDRGDVVDVLHRTAEVLSVDFEESGTRMVVRVHPAAVALVAPFAVTAV